MWCSPLPSLRNLVAPGQWMLRRHAVCGGPARGHPAIRRVLKYDKRGADSGPLGLWRMAKRVRAENPDSAAYCAQGSLRSALLAALAGIAPASDSTRPTGDRSIPDVVAYRAGPAPRRTTIAARARRRRHRSRSPQLVPSLLSVPRTDRDAVDHPAHASRRHQRATHRAGAGEHLGHQALAGLPGPGEVARASRPDRRHSGDGRIATWRSRSRRRRPPRSTRPDGCRCSRRPN